MNKTHRTLLMSQIMIFSSILVLAGFNLASAQQVTSNPPAVSATTAPNQTASTTPGPNYIDTNGNGICDHWEARAAQGTPGGPNYIDRDGDGVCDNLRQGMRRGGGTRMRRGLRRGCRN